MGLKKIYESFCLNFQQKMIFITELEIFKQTKRQRVKKPRLICCPAEKSD